jgi:C-terminal processing protease CtpA/Prc
MKRIYSYLVLVFLFCYKSGISQESSLTQNQKVYGLSRFWSEAQFNFPYFNYLTKVNIDSLYYAYIDKVINTKDDFAYYQTLQSFASHYSDNHTYVEFPEQVSNRLFRRSFKEFRLDLSLIEDEVIVTNVGRKNINDLPIGSKITHIDSISVEQYLIKNVYPLISSSSTQRTKYLGVRNLLLGLENTSITISYKLPDGDSTTVTLSRGSNNDDWFLQDEQTFHKFLYPEISYLRINSFNDGSIVDSIEYYINELKTSKAIIIDIRDNGGGSSIIAKDIAQYFVCDSIVTGSFVKTRINLGNQRSRGLNLSRKDTIKNSINKSNYLMAKNLLLLPLGVSSFPNEIEMSRRITGVPVVVLTNAGNISAAEEFLIYLSSQENIALVGEPTGGGNGQPMLINLPHGGHIAVCSQYCSYSDGQEYYRTGIVPDIFVSQTLDDLMNGKDSVIEASVSYLMIRIRNSN